MPTRRFRHEALLYAGADDFVERAVPIVAGAVEAGEPVLVAVDAAKIELLRERLGSESSSVTWKDIRGIGGNPGRIIPVWRQFVSRHGPHERLLGFGEPIWPGRDPAALVEAQRHERLLNLAFANAANFTLLCPYDTGRLDAGILHEGHRSHPFIAGSGGPRASADYPGLDGMPPPLDGSLPEPLAEPAEFAVDGPGIARLRGFLARLALAAGIATARAGDLAVAVLAVASSRAGVSVVRVWRESGTVLAELRGLAAVDDPLAGREWPAPTGGAARGLWLANQLCDLVQLRSSGAGAVVRLRVGRPS